jgi:hypothetical protein
VVVVLVDKGKEDELHVANLVQGIKGVAVESALARYNKYSGSIFK